MKRALRLGYRPWAPLPVRRNPRTRNVTRVDLPQPAVELIGGVQHPPVGRELDVLRARVAVIEHERAHSRWVRRSTSIIRPANSQLA